MNLPDLPALPERFAVTPELVLPDVHDIPNATVLRSVDVFTADQFRAFTLAYGALVRERCASIAEDLEPIAGATVHDIARAIRAEE